MARRGGWPHGTWSTADSVLTVAGLAVAGVLGYAVAVADQFGARLIPADLLLALLLGAAGGSVASVRAARAERSHRGEAVGPPARSDQGWRRARYVVGYAAAGQVIATGICVLGAIAITGLLTLPRFDAIVAVGYGGVIGLAAAIYIGLPIGLGAGLVTGCSRSRSAR